LIYHIFYSIRERRILVIMDTHATTAKPSV